MTFQDMARAAVVNLQRRKVRTFLTSIGVIVGILTIIMMVSLGVGVQQEIQRQFAALGLENVFVRPRNGEAGFFTQFGGAPRERPISEESIAAWRALPNVVSVTPQIDLGNVTAFIDANGQQRRIEIVGPRLFANPFLVAPAALAGSLELNDQVGNIVLDRGALPRGVSPASVVGTQVTIVLRSPRGEEQRFPLTVLGVSDRSEDDVQATVADMAAMKGWWFNQPDYITTQGYDSAVIRASDVNQASQLVSYFRGERFNVQSLELILETANRAFAVINIMLASVGGLALFVASIGIVNTMIMAVYERTREIGTLKAIGASRGDIRTMFMLEAGLIGLLGGVVGVAGGWVFGQVLNRVILWYIEQEKLPIKANFFVIPWWLAVAGLGFALLVGVVAGLYPAARAARLDPLVALRYE